jgi:hypothetical protein
MFLLSIFFTLLSNEICEIKGIWTKFDLVRTQVSWGSKSNVPFKKISKLNGNSENSNVTSKFGFSVANIGDLNSDGVDDIAVGAIGESVFVNGSIQTNAGSIYVLFMNDVGDVASYTQINANNNGGPVTYQGDSFGYSVSSLGDVDGDGVVDIAVGYYFVIYCCLFHYKFS